MDKKQQENYQTLVHSLAEKIHNELNFYSSKIYAKVVGALFIKIIIESNVSKEDMIEDLKKGYEQYKSEYEKKD
jgi:DNA-binding ferritin-like protein